MRKVFRVAILLLAISRFLNFRSSYGTAASPGGYPTQVTAVYILQNLLYLRKVKVKCFLWQSSLLDKGGAALRASHHAWFDSDWERPTPSEVPALYFVFCISYFPFCILLDLIPIERPCPECQLSEDFGRSSPTSTPCCVSNLEPIRLLVTIIFLNRNMEPFLAISTKLLSKVYLI